MTQEEKARAYDEAKYIMKEYLESGNAGVIAENTIKNAFPELAESEDERVRQFLIHEIEEASDSFMSYYNMSKKDVLAWLEKQSTPQVRTGLEWVNTIDDACDKRYSEEYAHGEYCHEQSFKWGFQEGVDWLEKQSKNSPVFSNSSNTGKVEQKSVDKIEPKFKVGNKIKLAKEPKYPAREIIAIQNDAYYFDEAIYLPFSRQDEWELVEQNPAGWSEEDKEIIDYLIDYLESELDSSYTDLDKETFTKEIDWLKSLRPQSQWKPSDEQMIAIQEAMDIVGILTITGCRINSLYQDLKKLKA